MGETIGQWADGLDGHRIRALTISTRACADPDDLIDAVADVRRRARQAIDRRRREEARWGTIRVYAVAMPLYAGGQWRAEITGVVHLGRAPEVALEDALTVVAPTRIRRFENSVVARDVRAHVQRVISTTAGLHEAGRDGVAHWYGAVDRAGGGGWRAITWSRGLQEGAR